MLAAEAISIGGNPEAVAKRYRRSVSRALPAGPGVGIGRSARRKAVSGDLSDGFITTLFPDARAGAIFQQAMSIG